MSVRRFAGWCSLPQRFRRNQSGTTAIEFGFVALPFFALMFAIIETALSFFTSQVLETATADAARLIMTGQLKSTAPNAQADFTTAVCNGLTALIPCANIQLDARTSATFNAADISRPVSGGAITWTPQFNTGSGGDIVVVRVVYPMPVYTNIFGASVYGASLANLTGKKILLMATSVFRNEPFL
jgi:Flp pilus assembly protein TadG